MQNALLSWPLLPHGAVVAGRPPNVPPGRPIGPGGQQLPPGRPVPGHGGRAAAEPESAHGGHGEEHCPGHGPDDPPHHVNW